MLWFMCNPRIKTLDDILRALGMRLTVTRAAPQEQPREPRQTAVPA